MPGPEFNLEPSSDLGYFSYFIAAKFISMVKGLWTLMQYLCRKPFLLYSLGHMLLMQYLCRKPFLLYSLGHMLQRMKVRQYNFWSGDVIIFKISFKLKMWGLNFYISLQTNGKISPFKCMVKAHLQGGGRDKRAL